MTPEEFRQAYFDQYSEEDDVCDDTWFQRYFDNSNDWLEVEFRSPDEGFVVYSDPESDVGGYWATTVGRMIEGPFQTMGEVAVALGYSPGNFPPDVNDDDDLDDLDDLDDPDEDLDAEVEDDEDDEPEFDEDFDEAYDEDTEEDGDEDD